MATQLESQVILFKRMLHWKDKSAKDKLVEMGCLIPLPRHCMCNPGECWTCDLKDQWSGFVFWFKVLLRLEPKGIPVIPLKSVKEE